MLGNVLSIIPGSVLILCYSQKRNGISGRITIIILEAVLTARFLEGTKRNNLEVI